MTRCLRSGLLALATAVLFLGCATQVYAPGSADNPLHRLKLGQTYGEMTNVLGKPDHSRTDDRTGQEAVILFVPLWNIVEAVGDFNPSMVSVYTYDRWGTVTIDNNNRIIRIEGR